jgi:hypothetical protein
MVPSHPFSFLLFFKPGKASESFLAGLGDFFKFGATGHVHCWSESLNVKFSPVYESTLVSHVCPCCFACFAGLAQTPAPGLQRSDSIVSSSDGSSSPASPQDSSFNLIGAHQQADLARRMSQQERKQDKHQIRTAVSPSLY